MHATAEPRTPRPVTPRHRRPVTLALLAAALVAGCDRHPTPSDDVAAHPNVVVVFVDDMGYGDLSCQGETRWRTPRLDAMAAEGVRFTDFSVAQPVCSASRTALLTGCYPNRLGIHGALGPDARHGIADGETTLGELFQHAGYATAIYGKWHLGCQPPFLPTRHGFDEWAGIPYSNDMGPRNVVHPERWGDLPSYEGESVATLNEDQSRFTTEYTARAIGFIERAVADERPFFVYLAQPMPHTPLAVSAAGAGASGAGLYGDVIVELDREVGRLLDALQRLGVDDDTLVLFTSDNGPWLSFGDHAGTTGGLREGKGTNFEGGTRVPALLRWPGVVPAGQVVDQPLMTIDVLPTLAGLIGAALPAHGVDGRDMWPWMIDTPGLAPLEREFAFYYQRGALEAVRQGHFKLQLPHGYRTMAGRTPGHGGIPGEYDYGVRIGLSLFDLAADPGETTDVSARHPDVLAALLALADAYRADLGDSLTGVQGTGLREPGRLPDLAPDGGR